MFSHRRMMEMESAAKSILPFQTYFNTGAGSLPAVWNGASWATDVVGAYATPAAGSDIVTNGDFSAWTAGNPDWWSRSIAAPAEVTQVAPGNSHGGGGVGAANFFRDATHAATLYRAGLLTATAWYSVVWDLTTAITAVNQGSMSFGDTGATVQGGNSFSSGSGAVATWRVSGRAAGTQFNIDGSSAAAGDTTIDNVHVYPLTFGSLYAYRDIKTANVDMTLTIAAHNGQCYCGGMVRVDNPAAPANYLLFYHKGPFSNRIFLDRIVAGTRTNLINSASTYVAGKNIRLWVSGTTAKLYYNGAQIGADQTVPASTATNIALLSTDVVNRISFVSCANP